MPNEEMQKTQVRLPRAMWLELHRIVQAEREDRYRTTINSIIVSAVERWIAEWRKEKRS